MQLYINNNCLGNDNYVSQYVRFLDLFETLTL